jgi:hypothetical protein
MVIQLLVDVPTDLAQILVALALNFDKFQDE